MREVRLYISVASCRDWKPQFVTSLVGLTYQLTRFGVKGCKLLALEPQFGLQASCLSQAREKALIDATNRGFTHWLSLDDDMVFPSDIVDRLIAHEKPFVAANYRRKCADVAGVSTGMDGEMLDSTGKTGLEEILLTGGGCFLADLKAIANVPAPRFEVVWCPEREDYFDQDGVFCFKMRQHGHQLFVDHDASQHVQHIGDTHYKFPQIAKIAKIAEAA